MRMPTQHVPVRHVLVVLALFMVLAFVVPAVSAKPIAVAQADKAVVTFTDEKCALPDVKNLPNRMTWIEGGKVFEGCGAVAPAANAVAAYFEDKTVVVIPLEAFQRPEPAI